MVMVFWDKDVPTIYQNDGESFQDFFFRAIVQLHDMGRIAEFYSVLDVPRLAFNLRVANNANVQRIWCGSGFIKVVAVTRHNGNKILCCYRGEAGDLRLTSAFLVSDEDWGIANENNVR